MSRMRALRERHGLTRGELAKLTGLSEHTIRRTESEGCRCLSWPSARRLARALGTDVLDLLT